MPKCLTFADGVLVREFDDRTVTACRKKSIAAIKAACADAITQTGIGWMVEREISGGKAIPADIKALCAEYRAKSNNLEAQVNAIADAAYSDNDKDACDLIEQVVW